MNKAVNFLGIGENNEAVNFQPAVSAQEIKQTSKQTSKQINKPIYFPYPFHVRKVVAYSEMHRKSKAKHTKKNKPKKQND